MKFFLRNDGSVYWLDGNKRARVSSMARFIMAAAHRGSPKVILATSVEIARYAGGPTSRYPGPFA